MMTIAPASTVARVGTINFFGTHIGAWAEEPNGDVARRRLRSVLGHMSKRGFAVERDPKVARDYPTIANGYYVARRGDLEFAAEAAGRSFSIEFFPRGGRYEHDKFARLPRAMQLVCAVELRHVLRKMIALGFALDERQGVKSADLLAVLRHAQGRTNEGDPLAEFNRGWGADRFERDTSGWPVPRESGSYNCDRDRVPLVTGEEVYTRQNGRLYRGVARPAVNGSWMLLSNGSAVSVAPQKVFRCADPSAEPRRLVPGQGRRLRLELEKALKANAFRRVETLARLLAEMPSEGGDR